MDERNEAPETAEAAANAIAEAAASDEKATPDTEPASDAAAGTARAEVSSEEDAGTAREAPEAAATDENAALNAEATSDVEAGTARARAARRLAALRQRLAESELRSAAALAGVPRERVPYVARMADTSGIDPADEDAAQRYAEAVERVLSDVPELRGGSPAGTGGAGNFARKTADAGDPIMARIEKNILGA